MLRALRWLSVTNYNQLFKSALSASPAIHGVVRNTEVCKDTFLRGSRSNSPVTWLTHSGFFVQRHFVFPSPSPCANN